MTIARNIGMVDGLCGIIQEFCANYKILLIQVSPKEKCPKMDAETFKTLTGGMAGLTSMNAMVRL